MTARLLSILALLVLSGLSGCSAWRSAPVLPVRNSVVLEQLVVYSDFPLPQHHRLLDELAAQRGALSTRLGLPTSDEPIHVYLFRTAEQFQAFMRLHYPDLPARRAFFVESDTRLMVYAYWGDRVAEDLRHEVAHGYLHSILPRLPLWLDEGLAEYFEVSGGHDGLNTAHVGELHAAVADQWKPDLARLEGCKSAAAMTQLEYAEAWAWVHYLLETSPETRQALQAYLQGLRKGGWRQPLSTKLHAAGLDDPAKLTEHVESLTYVLQ